MFVCIYVQVYMLHVCVYLCTSLHAPYLKNYFSIFNICMPLQFLNKTSIIINIKEAKNNYMIKILIILHQNIEVPQILFEFYRKQRT